MDIAKILVKFNKQITLVIFISTQFQKHVKIALLSNVKNANLMILLIKNPVPVASLAMNYH